MLMGNKQQVRVEPIESLSYEKLTPEQKEKLLEANRP
jgi:hypothetical protein